MQGIHLRKYGVEAKIPFVLYEVDGVDLRVDAADGGSDCSIMKDEGAEATCTNDFVDEGKGYSITLTATEMQAARIVVYVVDSATKVWLDDALVIETYGNASAQHAMDLDDAVRGGLTALPNANADAAGGLPISDAGGLDMDAIGAKANEITVHETTIAVVTDDKTFTLTASGLDGDTSADDDAWNNASVTIEDVTGTAKELRTVEDYTGATKTVILDRNCKFNLAAGDIVRLHPSCTSNVVAAVITDSDKDDIVDKMYEELDSDHMTPGTKGLKIHHSGRGRY